MKEYIKTIIVSAALGIVLSELLRYTVEKCIGKPFALGSTTIVIGLLITLSISIYELMRRIYTEKAYRNAYRKGYLDGISINKYKIIIPMQEDISNEQKSSRIA